MAKGLWIQLVYVHIGASSKKLARVRQSVLSLTRGWDQAQVRQLVGEKLSTAIDPITYAEAKELIDDHRQAGRRVYLVSAAPAEIVEPLARHFGAHEALASLARVGSDGRYTANSSDTPTARKRPRSFVTWRRGTDSTWRCHLPTAIRLPTYRCWRRWVIRLPSTRTGPCDASPSCEAGKSCGSSGGWRLSK